jgi:hypothetical protein
MRTVFLAGAAAAVAFVVVNRALVLLNEPNDLAVAVGYFLMLAVISVASGIVVRLWRRL